MISARRFHIQSIKKVSNLNLNQSSRAVRTSHRSICSAMTTRTSKSNQKQSSSPSTRLSQISLQMSPPNNSRSASTSTARSALAKHDEAGSKTVLELSQGGLRTIMLNRPKALNALNKEMVDLIDKALDNFSSSPSCSVIALRGEGRALCSGGDVMDVVTSAASEDPKQRQKALDFFQAEFELDYKIAKLGEKVATKATKEEEEGKSTQGGPKHFVAFMDGITMGGGVGLSLHAPFRISTERTLFAMPETGIGYFPDVGVTRILARMDGKIGMYLGLTGARISGEEAYLTGLATHFIQSSQIEQVLERLSTLPSESSSDPQVISSSLEEYSCDPFGPDNEKSTKILNSTPFLGDKRTVLDYVFGQPSVEASFSCLEEITSENPHSTQASNELKSLGVDKISDSIIEFSKETLSTLKSKSPRSLKVTFETIIRARKFDIEDSFKNDMRLATVFCDLSLGKDFHTGVNFTLTKDPKTNKKRTGTAEWSPENLSLIDDRLLQSLFFGNLKDAESKGLKMKVPELKLSSSSSSSSSSYSSKNRMEKELELRGKGPLGWEPKHNRFALPSEAEFLALMSGDHPAAGNVKLESEEIENIVKSRNGGKVAGDRKIRDWLKRESSKRG